MAELPEPQMVKGLGVTRFKKQVRRRILDDDGFSKTYIQPLRSKSSCDTDFTRAEQKLRANLFRDEFNREDIHDRILVVQVMPDDYEMQELQAKLQVYGTDEVTEVEPPESLINEVRESEYAEENHDIRDTSSLHREEELTESVSDLKPVDNFSFISQKRFSKYREPEVYSDESDERVEVEEESKSESGSGFGHVYNFIGNGCEPASEIALENSAIFGVNDEASISEIVAEKCESLSDSGAMPCRKKFQENLLLQSESDVDIPIPWENENGSICATENDGAAVHKTESVCTSTYTCEAEDVAEESCDVYVLRESRVYVHASWLAVNSRYFRSLLFESGMKECSSKEFRMKVTESEEKAFMLFLESIYDPSKLNNLELVTLLDVLRLSLKYDVKFSALKARRVLKGTPLTLEVCEAIIEAVAKGGLTDLDDVMENVKEHLFDEFTPLEETWESEKFASLSKGALQILLSSDQLAVQSENIVFVALMRWITKHAEVYGDLSGCSDLLNLVRFEHVKSSYLVDVVRVHEVATTLDNFDAVYLAAITDHALPKKRRPKPRPRQWSEPKTPTFMWILDPDPDMFVFDVDHPTNSRTSSSFWYLGYRMHLRLDLSPRNNGTQLVLVVENISDDGSVKLAYDVDVKFSDGLHKSYTSEPFVYRGKSPTGGKYPFDEKYSLEEIKEILFGSSVRVTIIFEISVEKLLDD